MVDLKLGDAFQLIKNIPENSIDLILTDPPYDRAEEYMDRLTNMQKQAMVDEYWRILKREGNLATFCGYVDQFTWYEKLTTKGFKYLRQLIWVYKNPSHGKFRVVQQARTFIMAHETILLFARGDKHYFDNKGVVEISWFLHPAYSGLRRSAEGNPEEKLGVTPKPLKIARVLISRLCPPKGTVFDPFSGYGTFGVAASQLGRNFIGFEIRPEIYDIAWKRIQSSRHKPLTEFG
jgi:DNA modification methylase